MYHCYVKKVRRVWYKLYFIVNSIALRVQQRTLSTGIKQHIISLPYKLKPKHFHFKGFYARICWLISVLRNFNHLLGKILQFLATLQQKPKRKTGFLFLIFKSPTFLPNQLKCRTNWRKNFFAIIKIMIIVHLCLFHYFFSCLSSFLFLFCTILFIGPLFIHSQSVCHNFFLFKLLLQQKKNRF